MVKTSDVRITKLGNDALIAYVLVRSVYCFIIVILAIVVEGKLKPLFEDF